MPIIPQCLNNIVTQQKMLGYLMPSLLRAGAIEVDINKTESVLSIKFNQELKDLYTHADGIDIPDDVPCGKTGILPIHNFLSLANALEYTKSFDEIGLEEFFIPWGAEKGPGPALFPFLEDGAGNCYWVDLNDTDRNGQIFWTNTFGSSPDYQYDSLTRFFETLDSAYSQGLLWLDEEGYLTMDYEQFDVLRQKKNHLILGK